MTDSNHFAKGMQHTIGLYFGPEAKFEDVVKEAVKISDQTKMPVIFDFNRCTHYIRVGDTVKEALKTFRECHEINAFCD